MSLTILQKLFYQTDVQRDEVYNGVFVAFISNKRCTFTHNFLRFLTKLRLCSIK